MLKIFNFYYRRDIQQNIMMIFIFMGTSKNSKFKACD